MRNSRTRRSRTRRVRRARKMSRKVMRGGETVLTKEENKPFYDSIIELANGTNITPEDKAAYEKLAEYIKKMDFIIFDVDDDSIQIYLDEGMYGPRKMPSVVTFNTLKAQRNIMDKDPAIIAIKKLYFEIKKNIANTCKNPENQPIYNALKDTSYKRALNFVKELEDSLYDIDLYDEPSTTEDIGKNAVNFIAKFIRTHPRA